MLQVTLVESSIDVRGLSPARSLQNHGSQVCLSPSPEHLDDTERSGRSSRPASRICGPQRMDEYAILDDRQDRQMRRLVPRNGDEIRHPTGLCMGHV
jgi:hypothetical protein